MHIRYTGIIVALVFLISSCRSNEEGIENLADLNLYIQTDVKIDSVFVSNIGQDREFMFLPYSDTLRVNFKDSINDLYNVWFYSNGKQYSSYNEQLWLQGENIVVKGRFDKGLKLDTIIGSDLHYAYLNFQKDYKELRNENANDTTINSFLLEQARAHVNSPFSIEPSNQYYYRNLSNPDLLKPLHQILVNQNIAVKQHAYSPFNAIEKAISSTSLSLNDYQFYDLNRSEIKITLNSDSIYLIDLWFVNCPPCIKDHKQMLEDYDFLKEHHIEVIGISTDSNHEVWANFMKEHNYPWKNYRELDHYDDRFTTQQYISVFPTYFIIDGTGTIQYRSNSFKAVKDYIEKN